MSNETIQLSEREREILRLVATGATNQQIAAQLHISANTVKVHLRNIFGKIGVASRTEATVFAIRSGLVQVSDTLVEAEPVETTKATQPDPTAPDEPASAEPPIESVKPTLTVQQPLWRTVALPAALLLVVATIVIVVVLNMNRTDPEPISPAETAFSEATRWQSLAPIPEQRADFAIAAYDSRLYVIGGSVDNQNAATLQRFDPASNLWVTLGEKPTPATHIRAVTIGRRIYVPGGEDSQGRVLDTFEAYDPATQQWEELPRLPEPRSRYALVDLDGVIYLFGGWDGNQPRDEVFVYNPTTQSWTIGPPLPTARSNAAAAVIDRRIYVIGGRDASNALRVNEYYDPANQIWNSGAPIAEPVAQPASVGVVNLVLVFDAQSGRVFQYAPDIDSWTRGQAPSGVTLSSQAILIGTSVFIFGSGEATGTLHEYRAIFNTFLPGTINR